MDTSASRSTEGGDQSYDCTGGRVGKLTVNFPPVAPGGPIAQPSVPDNPPPACGAPAQPPVRWAPPCVSTPAAAVALPLVAAAGLPAAAYGGRKDASAA